MPRHISVADPTPVRVVIVTLDHHLSSVVDRAALRLAAELPGLVLDLHAAADWEGDPASLDAARAAVAKADIVIASMLFMEDHARAILPALQARRDACDAMVICMSAAEVTRLTRIGGFDMSAPKGAAMSFLNKLRPKSSQTRGGAGQGQLKMLRRIPQFLRFIPGTAQDVRAYFMALQYWLAGSEDNIANLVRMMVERYAAGPRAGLRRAVKAGAPVEYPDVGLYHPRLRGRIGAEVTALPRPAGPVVGTVGVLVMRSYVLAGNTGHYDGVIAALEARGLTVVPAFAHGLDARPAIERFFVAPGPGGKPRPIVDAVVSLTGFSLVGGPAYNDAKAAEEVLAGLDVPYVAAQPLEFQTVEQWRESPRGLHPVESTIMVAIPELDGAVVPMVFGGRSSTSAPGAARDMTADPERAAMLAARVARLVALRRTPAAERTLAIVLFNFPPNAGATGTAAYLSVFPSLFNTLKALAAEGYRVDLPADAEALRSAILYGNAAFAGTAANVHCRIPTDDHVRRERHLREIEAQWGPAPGRQQADGRGIQVLGARFGNIFVGVQPGFGYEGDPMRLLFERGFAPTHAFSAFYRWIREDLAAHAVLHFGTHGALEFMPGKQTGLSGACWPDRLIGDLPNIYLYAANNPSEGLIAKRRGSATLVSYLTPSITRAGLYRGLIDLKAAIAHWRARDGEAGAADAADTAELIQALSAAVDLRPAEPAWTLEAADAEIATLAREVYELENTLVPHGLHVVGSPPATAARADMLISIAEASHGRRLEPRLATDLAEGIPAADLVHAFPAEERAAVRPILEELARTADLLARDAELPALMRALDGRFIRPAPGGDLLRTPAILPTGRNVHGFDPFRIPSSVAIKDGTRQAARLIARHVADGHPFPESVALVLWGTDNLKSEGGPIAQALALMGARPRFDGYGRVSGAELVPLADLRRPRVDVVITLSGIFRDLLPMQVRLLAEASYLAAAAEEPVEENFVRKHALSVAGAKGCSLEDAALRVFCNADGAYGANVNHLIESSAWDQDGELAETFTRRKGFAYGRDGRAMRRPELFASALASVEIAYQNLESVELGVTTLDQYVDTLGGIAAASRRAGGTAPAVYIGDQTRGEDRVRSLAEQVALETRTRLLNPKWFEAMLEHGYEGVRQIEAHVTTTFGWSATTQAVAPWVYQRVSETFVLDPAMRARLAELNPTAAARVASRLIEASDRQFWSPDAATLDALRQAGEELEDRLEGVSVEAAA
ncbi:magnesium chelatase subunit H [Prosthecodimorpha staleyi]|uniref:magnesium chelatase n=1 Tax=Prosthecodimorpha staleyi TaxID=2840188 RepID=A0A947GCK9_9HYPH|nr:magnesium chelatase subunit H [Prosthecodimorpha staleyi]MBT9289862.1 magnesium chelatase subunit H [Prosthecodimorpha staleyi]